LPGTQGGGIERGEWIVRRASSLARRSWRIIFSVGWADCSRRLSVVCFSPVVFSLRGDVLFSSVFLTNGAIGGFSNTLASGWELPNTLPGLSGFTGQARTSSAVGRVSSRRLTKNMPANERLSGRRFLSRFLPSTRHLAFADHRQNARGVIDDRCERGTVRGHEPPHRHHRIRRGCEPILIRPTLADRVTTNGPRFTGVRAVVSAILSRHAACRIDQFWRGYGPFLIEHQVQIASRGGGFRRSLDFRRVFPFVSRPRCPTGGRTCFSSASS